MELSYLPEYFKIINLSNYFGKEAAILAGLENSEIDAYIIMDPDLEDPPNLLKMLQLWEDRNEIVLTKRKPSNYSFFSKKFLKKNFL